MRIRAPSKARQPEHYVVAVASWDVSWLFSVNQPKFDPGPYSELSTLVFRGPVHRPERFRYPNAEVTLSGVAELACTSPGSVPAAVGTLQAHKDVLHAYIHVPIERLAMLTAVASRIRVVALSGDKLLYQRSLIRSVHLDTEFKPEDW